MKAESKDVKPAMVERSATNRGKGDRSRPESPAADIPPALRIARSGHLDARRVALLQRFAGNRAVRHLLRQDEKYAPNQLQVATQPVATKAPADPVLDKLVESTVEELDDSPNLKVLLSQFLAAGRRGQLKEYGEALRSKPHKRKGDYLERFIEGIKDEGSQKLAVMIVGQFERAGIAFTLGLKEYTEGDKVAAQLKTGNEGDPFIQFFRESKSAPIRAFINPADAGNTYEFTFPWSEPTFKPRIVERTPGARGKMLISFTAKREKDLILSWQIDEFTEFPFLEGAMSHVVVRRFKTKRHRFFIASPQFGVKRPMFNAPELPDDAIFPPKWQQISFGYGERRWVRWKDRRAVRAVSVESQVAGIEAQKLLMRETAIAYVETLIMLSPLGPYYFGAEAILGYNFIRGEKLGTEERLLLGFLALLGMAAQRGGTVRGSTPKARPAALSEEAAALRKGTRLSEAEARTLIEVGESITAEEQAFLKQLEADVRAGQTIEQTRLDRLSKIVETSSQKIRPPVGGGTAAGEAATAAQGTSVPPSEIRFSQTSVSSVKALEESMKAHGWKGSPIDVVKMPDGKLTALDNTRVLAAHRARINVRANIHAFDESLPADMVERFTTKGGVPKTWGEAVRLRIGKQNKAYRTRYPNGSEITGSAE
jgi:hypothetical protein